MPRFIAFAYYLVSYSVGLAALALALASYLRSRTRAAWYFFLGSAAFSILAASGIFMNFAGSGGAPALSSALHVLNLACAAAFVALLPILAHSVYRPARSRGLNLAAALLAASISLSAAALALAGFPAAARGLVLGAKDAAILYAVAWIAAYRERRHDGELENALHYVMIGTVIAFPVLAFSEFAPARIQRTLFPGGESLATFPIFFLVWSLSYIVCWFSGYVRPRDASDAAYRNFAERFGLSPRESEVMRLLLDGRSYKEIMSDLSLAMPTVKTHVGSIYRKTGCNNKMQFSLLFSSSSSHTKV